MRQAPKPEKCKSCHMRNSLMGFTLQILLFDSFFGVFFHKDKNIGKQNKRIQLNTMLMGEFHWECCHRKWWLSLIRMGKIIFNPPILGHSSGIFRFFLWVVFWMFKKKKHLEMSWWGRSTLTPHEAPMGGAHSNAKASISNSYGEETF